MNNGDVGSVLVWHAPLAPGSYDIVIDANLNGLYDAPTDGLDSGSPGFVVVADAPPTPPSTSSGNRPVRNRRSDRLAVYYRREQNQRKAQLNLLFSLSPYNIPAHSRNSSSNPSPPVSGDRLTARLTAQGLRQKKPFFCDERIIPLRLGKSIAFGKDCTELLRIYRIVHDRKTLI